MGTVTHVHEIGPGLGRVQLLPDLGRSLDRDEAPETEHAQHRQAARSRSPAHGCSSRCGSAPNSSNGCYFTVYASGFTGQSACRSATAADRHDVAPWANVVARVHCGEIGHPSASPCSMVLIGKERCARTQRKPCTACIMSRSQGVPAKAPADSSRGRRAPCLPQHGSNSGGTTNLIQGDVAGPRRPLTSVEDAGQAWKTLETRQLLSTYVVTNTGDNGGIDPLPHANTGTLRQAIVDANADTATGRYRVRRSRPRTPRTGTSRSPASIRLADMEDHPGQPPAERSLIPCTIDGYSQADAGIPFRYPSQLTLAVQTLSVLGSPTGGTFTLSDPAPLPVGTTDHHCLQRHARPRFRQPSRRSLDRQRRRHGWTRAGQSDVTITFQVRVCPADSSCHLQWANNLSGGTIRA